MGKTVSIRKSAFKQRKNHSEIAIRSTYGPATRTEEFTMD